MSDPRSRITSWLARSRPEFFSAFCIAAAFGTYFCMYAFRKPFTAATFEGQELAGVGYKTALVAAQVSGYTLSKCIGVRVVSELPGHRRAGAILVLIALAQLALFGFAVIPPPWNLPLLFLNGLPLGMVFGLVLGFLEGRRLSEALTAGLCASFIVSSGVVKSVGRWLIEVHGVSEYWMPCLTGLLFTAPLLLSVGLLRSIPPPGPEDVRQRTLRTTMDREARRGFLRRHGPGLSGLVLVYVLLTVMRSLRDDFAVEIWSELGVASEPSIFARSETLVMFGVVVVNGAAIRIRSNRVAFLGSLGLLGAGFVLVLLALVGHHQGRLAPFEFMVAIGFGAYVPYVAFHTTVFERLIAAFREPGTVAFLMYLADAIGYLATVVLLVVREWGAGAAPAREYLPLFLTVCTAVALVSIVITAALTLHYRARIPQDGEASPSSPRP